jgi:phosphoenolpyruvate carboxykinase (ATP)
MFNLEKRLESISTSLKSNSRNNGPRLYNNKINKIINNDDPQITYNSDFAQKVTEIIYNSTPAEYYEYTLNEFNTKITKKGALVAYSGAKTGRSPKDKRIMDGEFSQDVWFDDHSPNIKMSKMVYNVNKETAICYLNNLEKVFVFDGYACWHPEHRYKVRVISSRAYHCLFMYNMLIRPTEEELATFGDPDITIYNAGCFPCNRYTGTMTSSTSVALNLDAKEVVILGTQYAGEMKKAVFSMMHYFMPKKNILSLHSSCNVSKDGDNVCLFFGLSGTGKTTLSAEASRNLIGDDEHCWDDDGVFNIEGGCYAKVIDLDPKKEREIYNAIKFGSLFENTILDEETREVDFKDSSITQNIRLSYPIDYIDNAIIPCITKHPKNIILLTCDAFGVLPLVSKLTMEQTRYHFINGYTAKVAGTEDGVNEPEATFSSCYGEAFIVWHPTKYAEMLTDKIQKHNATCWLVNTGWVGGKYGVGKRCDINVTREIVQSIHNGSLLDKQYIKSPLFDLMVPKKYGLPSNTWRDRDEYDKELLSLYDAYEKNYAKYL